MSSPNSVLATPHATKPAPHDAGSSFLFVLSLLFFSFSAEQPPVERPVVDCLRDVMDLNFLAGIQVSDGSGNFQDFVIAPTIQRELIDCRIE